MVGCLARRIFFGMLRYNICFRNSYYQTLNQVFRFVEIARWSGIATQEISSRLQAELMEVLYMGIVLIEK